jgi:hypothetical protein
MPDHSVESEPPIVLVVQNTFSSRADLIKSQVTEPLESAERAGEISHLEVINTPTPDADDNALEIHEKIESQFPGQRLLLISAGGDTTANTVGSVQQEMNNSEATTEASGLYLPYGGYNIVAKALLGKHVGKILASGNIMQLVHETFDREFYTLAVKERGKLLCRAMACVGIGATARIADEINAHEHREEQKGMGPMRKRLHDGQVLLRELITSRRFLQGQHTDILHRAHDITVNNTPYMAEFLKFNAKTFDREVVVTATHRALLLGDLLLRAATGFREDGWAIRGQPMDRLTLVASKPQKIHRDGETLQKPVTGPLEIVHEKDPIIVRSHYKPKRTAA